MAMAGCEINILMKQRLSFIVLLLACVAVGFKSMAAQFTIGTVQELNMVLGKLKPGDVVIWKNGHYKDVNISFATNGEEQKMIFLKAETAGKVIFTGSSQLTLKGKWLQAEGFLYEGTSTLPKGDVLSFSSDAMHCRITNCAVINYSPVDSMVNNNWISLQGTYNEVDHCYFSGKTNQGPYLVVRYYKAPGYVDGSDAAPSTYHHIHHNYFGYRTLPTDNGGEDMRIGDSFTSFTHGFNIIEYNYFEDHRLEPEVISNKSWDNIYRFNTFINNDGQMVLRHGQKCFVYGNYFDGKSGRNKSGGIRIINANQTVFNNYITNVEGSEKDASKAAIVIMCGLLGSPLNGYYPADNALVAYNTSVNCRTPVYKIGYGNKTKGLPLVAPQHLTIVNNLVIQSLGNETIAVENEPVTYNECKDNFYSNGNSAVKGFSELRKNEIKEKDLFYYVEKPVNNTIVDSINQRLAIHNIKLTEKEITQFDPKWKLSKNDVGVSWIRK
jgi:poly(beta-D-mannuronate) lyase